MKKYWCFFIYFYISDIDTDASLSLSWTSIKDHWSFILEELEPLKTAGYLFQYAVFNMDTHDEIEAKKRRTKKAELIFHYLEEEFSSCMPTFFMFLKFPINTSFCQKS